jgi:hypothetical protein
MVDSSLPATVLSPAATAARHKDQFKGYSNTIDHVAHTGAITLHIWHGPTHDVCLTGIKKWLLLYTVPLVPLGIQALTDAAPKIIHLLARATPVLFHQRINHFNARRVRDLHKHVDGILEIVNPPYLNGCDI